MPKGDSIVCCCGDLPNLELLLNSSCFPDDDRPSPESWGLPMVHFPLGQDCDEEHFAKLKIVINLTFCGDWAGSKFSWSLGRCRLKGPSCDRYVRENPEAFSEAFWAVRHVQVYDKSDANGTPRGP